MNVKLVFSMRSNVKKRVEAAAGGGLNKRKVIEKAVFDELCGLLDSGLPKEKEKERERDKQTLKKGRPNVVMFVGLQVKCRHTSSRLDIKTRSNVQISVAGTPSQFLLAGGSSMQHQSISLAG